MSWTEPDWVTNTEAIDQLYLRKLGRRLDPNGLGSRVGFHMRENGRDLAWFEELLEWGELPSDKLIADGWDDGRWPMLIAGRPEAEQDAIIDRHIQLHRNTMLVLVTNPDAGNPPTYIGRGIGGPRRAGRPLIPTLHNGPDIQKAILTGQRIQSRGLRVHYLLWSWEAEQAFGDSKRRVLEFGEALPARSDIWPIEVNEYWNDGEWDSIGRELSRRHRVWTHYTPRKTTPAPKWSHGLMLQLEPGDYVRGWYDDARSNWDNRPTVLAELQGVPTKVRWEAFQAWLKWGGFGGCHVGAAK